MNDSNGTVWWGHFPGTIPFATSKFTVTGVQAVQQTSIENRRLNKTKGRMAKCTFSETCVCFLAHKFCIELNPGSSLRVGWLEWRFCWCIAQQIGHKLKLPTDWHQLEKTIWLDKSLLAYPKRIITTIIKVLKDQRGCWLQKRNATETTGLPKEYMGNE